MSRLACACAVVWLAGCPRALDRIITSTTCDGPDCAAALVFQTGPTGFGAGVPFTIEVGVRDGRGGPSIGLLQDEIAVSLLEDDTLLAGTKTADAVLGVATFADLRIDQLGGPYTLQAFVPGLTPITKTFSVGSGRPSFLRVVLDPPGHADLGSPLRPAPVVDAFDRFGHLATTAGDAITLELITDAPDFVLGPIVSATLTGGRAVFTRASVLSLGASSGTARLRFSLGPVHVTAETEVAFGAPDVEWARFPIGSPSFDVIDGEIVLDRATGLHWRRQALPAANAADAAAACAALSATVGDRSYVFRLPRRIELLTVLGLDSVAFGGATIGVVWSGSNNALGSLWTVDLAGGASALVSASALLPTFCVLATAPVRGAPVDAAAAPPGQYVGAGSNGEAVRDVRTGLMWQHAAETTPLTHSVAQALCSGATHGGFADWRLPSAPELATLVNLYQVGAKPRIDAGMFPATPAVRHWTATGTLAVNFADGTIAGADPNIAGPTVRCVR